MILPRYCTFVVLSAVALLGVSAAARTHQDPRKNISGLSEEKVRVLQAIVDATTKAHEVGKASFPDVVQARMDYSLGRLELAETPQQRVELLMEMVKMAEKFAEHAKDLYRLGKLSQVDVLKIEVALLDRKIALERENDR